MHQHKRFKDGIQYCLSQHLGLGVAVRVHCVDYSNTYLSKRFEMAKFPNFGVPRFWEFSILGWVKIKHYDDIYFVDYGTRPKAIYQVWD